MWGGGGILELEKVGIVWVVIHNMYMECYSVLAQLSL